MYEFPFDRPNYGPQRKAHPKSSSPFGTKKGKALLDRENDSLRKLAARIPSAFRGYALRNSDDATAYELCAADTTKHETLEPPGLRSQPQLFLTARRSAWTSHHDDALKDMRGNPMVNPFIVEIETVVGLDDTVLDKKNLWNVLREPYAGELVIPRKMRGGHRVHINPFAFETSRQLRVSSNFVSYSNCTAVDTTTGLDRETAARLIAAFLVSSFGQLQFEMEGVNREGLLALEKEQLARIRIFNPRWVRRGSRRELLAAFDKVPYPVTTSRLSSTQNERNRLDELFGEEIEARYPGLKAVDLVPDVQNALDEWIVARQS